MQPKTTACDEQELNAIIDWLMLHTGTVSITWRPLYPQEADSVYTVTWQNDCHRFAYWMHAGKEM